MENGLGWSTQETEGVVPAVRGRERSQAFFMGAGEGILLDDVAQKKASLDAFMAQLSDEDMGT